jgi:signal transduction histidine kinase
MRFLQCLFAVALLLVATYLPAQPLFSSLRISRLTPNDGLSQGSNYFRYEDSKGFMWLTANDALNRYDGRTVKVYNLNRYFHRCPLLQQGYGFAEDSAGNLYVGSIRGLYIYHRRKDLFTLQKVFDLPGDSTAMPFAYRDGKVWCFNRIYQLATYDVRTGAVESVAQLQLPAQASVHIYSMPGGAFYYRYPFMDAQGAVWAIGQRDIVAYDPARKRQSQPFARFLGQQKVNIITASHHDGRLFCGTDHGLLMLELASGQCRAITQVQGKPLGKVRSLTYNGQRVALFGQAGYYLLSADGRQTQPLDGALQQQLNKTFHYSFDRSGRLWTCDDGVGLLILDFNPGVLGRVPQLVDDDAHPLSTGCHTFAELPDGNMLLRSRWVLDKVTRQLRTLSLPFSSDEVTNTYRTCTDRVNKGVWFFEDAYNPELSVRNLFFYNGKKLQNLYVRPASAPINSQQKDMAVLADGRIACTFTEGLFWLKPTTNTLVPVPGTAVGAAGTNAFAISELSGGRFAVSHLQGSMHLYQCLPSDSVRLLRTILPGTQCFYLREDSVRQRFWVGSNQGVYLFDAQWQLLQHFDANNGLAGTNIYGLLLDDAGNAYCSHQRGLSQINTHNGQIINFDLNDGIQDWDFHNRAFLKASDGTLFFGGAKGINWIKPPLRIHTYYQPQIYVDEILVNNRPALPDSNADYIDRLTLDYQENNLTVKAVVKDLGQGNLYQLMYRIAETDTTWKLLPNGSSISFNQLAPGTYTLLLGGHNKYDPLKKAQRSLTIVIAAPFYRKAWFWALVGIVATASVLWWVYRRKLARQKDQFQQQLALEKQRQRITADLHDEIGASLSSLQINSAVAGRLLGKDTEAAKVVLDKIEGQAHKLATAIGDIVWSMKPGKEEFMTLSTKIKQFAGEMLEPGQIQFSIDIPAEIDKGLTDIALRKNLLLMLKEAINNAAKYSRATELQVSLHLGSGYIAMRVEDNGIGFDPQLVKGNGLGNMRHRATELGGTLSIQTGLGKGTVVTASIPLVP